MLKLEEQAEKGWDEAGDEQLLQEAMESRI